MKQPSIIGTIILATSFVGTPQALACSTAGPNTHVGTVVSVDKIAGTFTIIDAQSGNPVTLTADVSILEQAEGPTQVIVRYENNSGMIKAIELK